MLPSIELEEGVNKVMVLALGGLVVGIGLGGCKDKDGDDTGPTTGDGGGETGAALEDFVNVEIPPSGAIFTGDANGCYDGETWLEAEQNANLDSAKLGHQISMTGKIVDFQTGDPVEDATIEIWFDNIPGGSPDVNDTSAVDGTFGAPYPTCKPTAYRVTGDPELGELKETYEVNQVEAWAESAKSVSFYGVSSTTYAKIPSLLGVSPDADKGIAAGSVFDCRGKPVLGAQVVAVSDKSNTIPESLVVKYYVDNFPNRDQPYTSSDGLWLAVNIPTGDTRIQAWVSDGAGGHIMIGQTKVPIQADSINIANIYAGYEEGIVYPANCRSDFD